MLRLISSLHRFAEVGAQVPTPNPNHDAQRDLDQVQGKAKKAITKT
jgi:hypothetical protein